MSIILTIVCVGIFLLGCACYGLAFQMDSDTLALLVFAAGILLNSIAFFIPWQIIGHSRKDNH